MNALTSEKAIELLRTKPDDYANTEALQALVAQVDTHADGKVTWFYGGFIDEVHTDDIMNGMIEKDPDIRSLNKTEAYKFLKSREFLETVAKIHGASLDDVVIGSNTPDTPEKLAANAWLENQKTGPWAVASQQFAADTVGAIPLS